MRRGAASWGLFVVIVIGTIPFALTLTSPPAAALTEHGPIRIQRDADFTAANGVTGGNGTLSDPYVIEGWRVGFSDSDGITIRNTTAYYVLRNLTISSGFANTGVRLEETGNAWLVNLTMFNCGPAVRIDTSSNVTIVDSHFVENPWGASVTSSVGITFARNEFRNGGELDFDSAQWVNVTENVATGPQFRVDTDPYGLEAHFNVSRNRVSGIQTNTFELNGIDGIVVEGNQLSGTGPGIVVQRSSNVSVTGNAVSGGGTGIDITGSRRVTVARNNVTTRYGGDGINVAHSSEIVVAENEVMAEGHDVEIQSNLNVTLSSNRALGRGFWLDADTIEQYRSIDAANNTVNGLSFVADRGCVDRVFDTASIAQIFLVECQRITIRNQTFDAVETGVKLINVTEATLDSSVFENSVSDAAVRVVWGSNVTIERSNFTTNRGYGIWSWYTDSLTVIENTLRENWLGLQIWKTADARIVHNNFVRNQASPLQAVATQTVRTFWDDGFPAGGNYWSDYLGPDACTGPGQDNCGQADGLGDAPLAMTQGSDRYPLIRPYGRPALPPIAQIAASQTRVTVGQTVGFYAGASLDPDGTIVAYAWDFGDGGRNAGSSASHSWGAGGVYRVILTVRDNSFLTNSASVDILVDVPTPFASITMLPSDTVYINETVTFDGSQSGSGSPYAGIDSYAWDLGDGTLGSGVSVTHRYETAGLYSIQLTVTNGFGVSNVDAQGLIVQRIPDVPLRSYESHAGFRVPIPSHWELTEDQKFEDLTFEVVLRGPDHEGVRTNLLIDTDVDSTIREDRTYFAEVITAILQSAQESSPGSYLSEEPTYRTIANYAGVVFALTDPAPPPLVQKFAIILSDAHDRYWILALTAHADFFFLYNATFERMVNDFEITMAPPIQSLFIWIGLAVGIVSAVLVAIVLIRRKKARVAAAGRPIYSAGRPEWRGYRYCPRCGTAAKPPGRFCGECGNSLISAPAVPLSPQAAPATGQSDLPWEQP